MAVKKSSLKELFSDHFTGLWRLLSETTRFLGRTAVFGQYENQLRLWRLELQSGGQDAEVHRRIRRELTELRKSLRLQGYDLSLAKQQLVFEGFKNDAALAEGWRRVVIFFGEEDIYWLAGDDNHITLSELLERQLGALQTYTPLHSKHYLWYLRRGDVLAFSGSDTETPENFERLKAMGAANSLVILGKLRGLK
jgi:hypothetical protein